MKHLLPVGSVVLLEEATRYVVIIGYAPVEEGSDKVWDYLGCAYPIGVIGTDKNLLFNRDKIEKIIYTGFVDDEGTKFISTLEKEMEKIK